MKKKFLDIGNRFNDLRVKRGWSKSLLAHSCELKRQNINRYLDGTADPTKILRFLLYNNVIRKDENFWILTGEKLESSESNEDSQKAVYREPRLDIEDLVYNKTKSVSLKVLSAEEKNKRLDEIISLAKTDSEQIILLKAEIVRLWNEIEDLKN